MSKIVEKGNTVMFTEEGCIIKDRTNKVKATAYLRGSVYLLETKQEEVYATRTETQEDQIWHRRLGHLNRKGMTLLKRGLVKGLKDINISSKNCEACVKGKQSRLTFKSSNKQANHPLDIVHSDICGPMSVNSIGGARYFLTFIDDHTRKMFVYFLKHKSETADVFLKFKALVENQTGRRIKVIRTMVE